MLTKKQKNVRFLTQAAAIAALYMVLSLPFLSVSFNVVQFRLSEALTILPFFTPAAIPGLFVGCLLTNIMGSSIGLVDIIIGSSATLLAACLSYGVRKNKWLVPLMPVIVNAFAIGIMLYILGFSDVGLGLSILFIAISQIIVCYGLGMPLLFFINKQPVLRRFFYFDSQPASIT